MPVKLVIKAPNQKIPDHLIDCDLSWDVLRLKKHLSEVYPNNPKPEEQRLIYAGRLIKNHLTLKDFINYEEGQKYTLHLVCTQQPVPSPTHSNNLPPSDLNVPSSPSQSQSSRLLHRIPTSPSNDDSSSSSSSDGANGGSSSSSPVGLPGANLFPGLPNVGAAVNPEVVAQQMAAMQHFYAQYMAQFMQQAQLAGFPATYPDLPSLVLSPSNTPAAPPVGVPAENVAPANVNRAQAVGNQNMRMNAQGGPLLDDEEEDAENRDWLDWFYILSRALVLFSILFFYSSLGRFMVVTGVAILIYMYQGGWFGGRLPAVPPAPQAEERENEDERRQNDNAPEEQNQEPVSSPEAQREPANENPDEIQNVMDLMDGNREPNHHRSEPNLIQTFWLFLTSFFVSLIPEQPPPVNVN